MKIHILRKITLDHFLFRMAEEFRIQHLASVIQKSLKTSIKPDVIAKEFLENKTAFVTAQVSSVIFRVRIN